MTEPDDPWAGLRDLLRAGSPRPEDVKPISAADILKAVDDLMNAPYRVCHHLIPPNVDVIYDTRDLDGTERAIPCAAMCGAVLTVREKKPLMQQLLDIEMELRYRHAPVEGRLDAASLRWLRDRVKPDPTKPNPPAATPLDLISGIRLIVDPTMPPNLIRFYDTDGYVTHEIVIS